MSISICILDNYELKRYASEAIKALGVSEMPAMFVTNERASKYNVRGRRINKVYLVGLFEHHIDPILRDNLDANNGPIEYIEVA